MTIPLVKLTVLSRVDEPLHVVINRMASSKVSMYGIALVVDENMVLHGVINNGDVLRLVAAGIDLLTPVGDVMVRDPVTAPINSSDHFILNRVRTLISNRTGGKKDLTRYVPLVDSNRVVLDVVDVFSLLARSSRQPDYIEVYGLGFVGLTVSVALASRGHFVTGIDINPKLVDQLVSGVPHVHERRLPEMLRRTLKDQQLTISTQPSTNHHRVVLIAVGTPVDDEGNVSLKALQSTCEVISSRLKRGDLVMLRSTVPVGTTRGLVRALLENGSNMKAGEDFHLSFTPERTVEGQAMDELISLPQIVGGLTPRCCERAVHFWQTLTDTVVTVESLEAAEMVKLINNSFRDLSFSFSNGFALLADQYNLDAARVISAANEGYPRSKIPSPSPGVGGYCLTKDPFLYASVAEEVGHGVLSGYGRRLNEKAGNYPIRVVQRFADRIGKHVSELSVLVVGLAFKGLPETNDVRGSNGVHVCSQLVHYGCCVYGHDSVIDSASFEISGVSFIGFNPALDRCDALLIMNNHPNNVPDGFFDKLSGRPVLLFDGWSLLNRHEVEQYDNITYSCMGYMTP